MFLNDSEDVYNTIIKSKKSVMIKDTNHFDLYDNYIRLLFMNFDILKKSKLIELLINKGE
ncbi:hypothetical protein B6D19_04685 [Gilliamella apicola]|nr:hypothetical protein B6D19_04685 [Gilliamella apicola]OTQ39263.1 hypothetical protein B6D20_11085 [Gilliamella apicola]